MKAENEGAFAEVPRRWLMLDLDGGVPLPPGCSVLADPAEAARAVLDILAAHAPELEGVSAVVQFSSSAGLDEMAAGEAAVAGETASGATGAAWRSRASARTSGFFSPRRAARRS